MAQILGRFRPVVTGSEPYQGKADPCSHKDAHTHTHTKSDKKIYIMQSPQVKSRETSFYFSESRRVLNLNVRVGLH